VGGFDEDGKATACGCASQPGAPVGGGLVALGAGALALLRRRRRS
jgi:MYXO-CTERM domain-containing protein